MFKKARLRLTAWYLLIIMSISLTFSTFIYRSVTREFQRRLNVIEHRFDFRKMGIRMPKGPQPLFLEDIEAARKSVLVFLIYANGAIFVFSGLAGYFLAGRTLKPIEDVLEEQKRFVADASHELKTPLTALQTSIEVTLRDKKLKLNDARRVLNESLEDIDSLKKLANNLLSLAKYQGGDNFTFEKVSVKKLVENAYKKVEPIARKNKVKVHLDVKDVKVLAIKDELEKLITIFLDNAVKYSRKGGKVSLRIKRNKKYLKIIVKDNGIGISKEDLPHIFDRFWQADSSRSKTKVVGFGLGLSMAKRIAEIHKGSINVTSTLSKGSIFTLKLPL